MVPAAWRHAGMTRCKEDVSSAQPNWLSKALSEIPCRVSSDLHEWRNDFNAVSTRGSVKLQSRLKRRGRAARRKAPRNLYYNFILDFGAPLSRKVGGFEARTSVLVE